MAYSILRLAAHDTETLRDLLRVFAEAFDDPVAYRDAVPDDAYLRTFLARDDHFVVVARDERRVVGGLVAYELMKFERRRKEIYIYDLAVVSTHRRRGIARGVIAALKDIARSRGAYVIYVQADPGDEAAIALYDSLGSKEDVHHFDIDPNA